MKPSLFHEQVKQVPYITGALASHPEVGSYSALSPFRNRYQGMWTAQLLFMNQYAGDEVKDKL